MIRFRSQTVAGLFFAVAALVTAQAVPGRYIVEFEDEPALVAPAAGRFRMAEAEIGSRRTAIRQAQNLAEPSIRQVGATVRARFDLVFNGMAVEASEQAADALRQMPGVRAVYPDVRHYAHLDHAVNVHKIREAWQSITNGQMGAGAGIKIGVIDSGIDTNHPAFQGFTTAVPEGFPKLSAEALRPFSNNKVIVVRDYTGEGGTDQVGHGTGVAMAAAGGSFDPKVLGIPTFTGVAPGAWLGSYHTIGSDGSTLSSRFLTALQDAIADGMNVINYSAGGPVLNASDETGPSARAITAALAAGVVVVVSAGNDGPEPGTAHAPGASADALTVGANRNERIFDIGVSLADLPGVPAEAGSNSSRTDQVQGIMVDVGTLDPTGLGCSALPQGSLKEKIALVSRGECPFDDKANFAETAGAIGIVVYNNDPNGGLVRMSVPTATVATMFVTNASGLALKAALASMTDAPVTLDFSGSTAVPVSSDDIAYFSAGGPTVSAFVKPDLLAVGSWVVTANTTQDTEFNVAIQDGTSFSAPIVTGAVAALMGARPGLTGAQYRSLIINSAPQLNWPSGEKVGPQIAGSGKLNLLRALQNPTAASPASIHFAPASGAYDLTESLRVTNLGDATDTFTVSAVLVNTKGAAPTIDTPTLTLAKGESKTVQIRLVDGAPEPGEVHGFLEITGTKTSVIARVPYWLGVRGSGPRFVALLQAVDFTYRSLGDEVTFYMRVLDSAGLPVEVETPEITTTAPRAALVEIAPAGSLPGTYQVTLRVGRADPNGLNVFTITAGGAKRDIVFVIR